MPSLEALEAALQAASSGPERTRALNALAWELRSQDVARAHALALEARDLAKGAEDVREQARATRTMAMTIRDLAQLPDVFRLAEEARMLFDQTDDLAGRAAARDFLASIREYVGDYAGALELALDALRIARRIDDPIRQGYALSNVGGVLAASGDVEAGVERLQEALRLFEEAGSSDGITAISSRLSRVLEQAGRSEEARTFAEKCLELAERRNDQWLFGNALAVLADLERGAGRLDQAAAHFERGLNGLTEEPVRTIQGAELLVGWGRVSIAQARWAEAQAQLDEALARIGADGMSVVTETAAHDALSEVHEQEGRHELALHHLRRAQALRQETARKEAQSLRAQVQMRAAMEAAEKEAELQRARYAELRAMQSKLIEAEKMAILGKLAAGTAHELNSPVGVLKSSLDLLRSCVDRRVTGRRTLDEAEAARVQIAVESAHRSGAEALARLGRIADSYRRFTKLDEATHQRFDVREGLESAIALTEASLPEAVRIERRFEEVPVILGWPRELNHGFLTVLQNAVDAVGDAGRIEVVALGRPSQVWVEIRDDGRGMSESLVAELFELDVGFEGQRAKMRLGLPATKSTVERHGGRLEVESELGKGTCIRFVLPSARHPSDF